MKRETSNVRRQTSNVKAAVILAGGAGARFWPSNVVRNKAAFPIANVPLVRRLAEDLVCLGVSRLVVVVGHGEASVRAALRGVACEVAYVRQSDPGGTAAAAWIFTVLWVGQGSSAVRPDLIADIKHTLLTGAWTGIAIIPVIFYGVKRSGAFKGFRDGGKFSVKEDSREPAEVMS